jgi:hypothetical protein
MERKQNCRDVDALVWVVRDHNAIKRLFVEYERLVGRGGDDDSKGWLVGHVCLRLSSHLQIEEDVFYPALRSAIGQVASLNQALLGHHSIRELIAGLDEMEPGESGHDAKVALLAASMRPHMEDQQREVFPLVRNAGLDTATLGRRMVERRKALHEDVTRIGLPSSTRGAAWPGDFCAERTSPASALNWG